MQHLSKLILIAYMAPPLMVSAQTQPEPTPNLAAQCQVAPPPAISLSNLGLDYDDEHIIIESKKSVIEKNKKLSLSGDVVVSSGQNKIRADQVLIDKDTGLLETRGKTQFQNNKITVSADRLSANSTAKEIELINSDYRLTQGSTRGHADSLTINEQGLRLTESTFTTCSEPVPDWQLSAADINLSTEDNQGEAWNTVFRIKDIPVFYLPYFNFPLTDDRKTGFLYPKISTSGNRGFEFGQPFYWNIAPNMDATITPYYMSKRGTQLLSEFRYLTGGQFGQLNVEYLNRDRELVDDSARYLHRFQHFGTFSERYRLHLDYSDISDDNYLVDIGSDQFNKSDAYLWRIGELAYFADFWHSSIKLQDFKVLGDSNDTYRTLPQLEAQMYLPLGLSNATFNVYSEYSHFEIADPLLPTADRFHVEAGLSLPVSRPGWFIDTDARLMHTYFKQDNLDFVIANSELELEPKVNRTLPKVRLHAGLNFDRDADLFFQDKTQTFEPQIQYLYIPKEDQNNIFIYDTSPLQDDFNGLFRDRRFSGLDRIAQANQISLGATTRILSADNAELFRLSLGRIFYLKNSNDSFDEEGQRIDQSSLAADLFLQLLERWQLQTEIQYDTESSSTEKSQISLDYRHSDGQLAQLSHRYIKNFSGEKIEQVRALTSFPINENWTFVGHVTQDLVAQRSLEAYTGFQYESCCWAVRFAYHRDINTNFDVDELNNQSRDEYDSGFMIQFVLKGLGSNQQALPIDDMLESGIFGYKRPYFLTN
ncbi:LPS assembly protein LptD [Thalassotalea ponticola]|uniref:LPS assembly protein LptD n=1 Tax=Thalassotalea ponticola TaxID=1523392 RepID=UPI0025B4D98B|nr:LPS assembly protein LptD [Thalassotalea ponticola]MDN3653619.1 LPS assembly protein LptD [Thalassotalea ponticola]